MSVTGDSNDGFSFEFKSEAVIIEPDMRAGLDLIATALLFWHRATIYSGQKPDGSGGQPGLGPRARNAEGRVTKYRGARSGVLADGLRSRVTGSPSVATAMVLIPGSRRAYAMGELERGNYFLTLEGKAREVVDLAAKQWWSNVLGGAGTAGGNGERTSGGG